MYDWVTLVLTHILVPALVITIVIRTFMGSKARGALGGVIGFMVIAMVTAQYYTGNAINGFFHPITMGWKLLYDNLMEYIIQLVIDITNGTLFSYRR